MTENENEVLFEALRAKELERLQDAWEEAAMEEFTAEIIASKAQVEDRRARDMVEKAQETWQQKSSATRKAREAWFTAAMEWQHD